MKRFLLAAIPFLAIVAGCKPSANPGGDEPVNPDPDPVVVEWRTTYNGKLVLGLAGAYDNWVEKGSLSTTVNWEGISIFQGEFLRAGLTNLLNMVDDPDGWMLEDVVYPEANVSYVTDNPFLPKQIPFSDFLKAARAEYAKMVTEGAVDARFSVEGYDSQMTNTALLVMVCRACAYFRDNEEFPETIDTWEASYIRSTSNSPIDDATVIATRHPAWKAAGVTEASTDREKAVAIFNYARDEWEWENYNNTKKGAVGTINAKAGNCCDMSHAICAMARLSGIPARYFHAQCHYSSGYIGHVISQIFVDNKWEFADATNNNNSFGEVQFTDYTGLHYYEELPF